MNWFSKINLMWVFLGVNICVWFAALLATRFHVLVGVLFAVLTVSALWTFGYRYDQFAAHPEIEWLLLARDSALTFAVLFTTAVFFASQSKRSEYALLVGVSVIWLVSCLSTTVQLFYPWELRRGLSGDPSMNGCLIAITLPVFLELHSRNRGNGVVGASAIWWTALCVFACNASVPIGALIVVTLAAISYLKLPIRSLLLMGGFTATFILAVGALFQGQQLFSSSNRFYTWGTWLHHWWNTDAWTRLFGFGTGTGIYLLPKALEQAGSDIRLLWIHNEYLQTLFENGTVGLALLVSLVGVVLVKARSRPWLFCSVAGLAAYSFFNFPARQPFHALVGAALIWFTFTPGENYGRQDA